MAKWALLTTAPNQVMAEMWRDLLVQEGVPATLHPDDVRSFIGVTTRPVRVMVAEDKLEIARKELAEWEEAEPEGDSEQGPDETADS